MDFNQREFLSKTQEESKRYENILKEKDNRLHSIEEELREKCSIIANQVRSIN